MSKERTDDERARQMAEGIWLHYFNRYLFESGTISETEYRRMTEKIESRSARLIKTQIAKGEGSSQPCTVAKVKENL